VRTKFPEWAVTGEGGRPRRFLTSIYLDPPTEEKANMRLLKRWQEVQANEVRYKGYYLDDAEYLVVGFGSTGRVALSAVRAARAEGIKVGLLRPITVNPFPTAILNELTQQVKGLLVVEMNMGQMLEDVRSVVMDRKPLEFFARVGGVSPLPDEILREIQRLVKEPYNPKGHPRDRWLARARQGN
jgi:2-oxoglutarate/2-oxoacid ferredoxin oxidoreductase subunit alpha